MSYADWVIATLRMHHRYRAFGGATLDDMALLLHDIDLWDVANDDN